MKPNQFYSQKQSSSKISLKAIILVGIMLILWIPLAIVAENVEDREEREEGVGYYFSSEYNNVQDVIMYLTVVCKNPDSSTTLRYLMPSNLDIKGDIAPQYLKQGRFDVLTYTANIEYSATFSLDKIIDNATQYGIADLSTATIVALNNFNRTPVYSRPINITYDKLTQTINGKFDVTGMNTLAFKILSSGSVSLKGGWGNPDFAAASNKLPTTRQVDENSFSATWDITSDQKSYVYSDTYSISDSRNCGVKLIVDVSQYQMVTRTIKYGMLIILFTFVSFFLTELWCKRSINIFQYLLAGFALVLFYLLLLSLSEYLRFGYAYMVASAMTLGLVMLYLFSVLSAKKPAIIIISLLSLLYFYTYILTQLTSYSLIAGSIGLFIILAAIMYASQRVFNSATDSELTNQSNNEAQN